MSLGDQSDGDYDERGLLVWFQLRTMRGLMMLFHKMGSTTGGQQQRAAGGHFVGMRLGVWTMRSMFMVTQWGVHRMYQRQYVKILHLALSKDGGSVLQEIGHEALCPGTDLGARPYLVSEYKFPPNNNECCSPWGSKKSGVGKELSFHLAVFFMFWEWEGKSYHPGWENSWTED